MQLASTDQSAEFSPRQLDFLQELLKCGIVGMAKVVADKLATLDHRIAQCEAAILNSLEVPKEAANASNPRTMSRRLRRQRTKRRSMRNVDEPRITISLWTELYGGSVAHWLWLCFA